LKIVTEHFDRSFRFIIVTNFVILGAWSVSPITPTRWDQTHRTRNDEKVVNGEPLKELYHETKEKKDEQHALARCEFWRVPSAERVEYRCGQIGQ
jgi:hypothetical protein